MKGSHFIAVASFERLAVGDGLGRYGLCVSQKIWLCSLVFRRNKWSRFCITLSFLLVDVLIFGKKDLGHLGFHGFKKRTSFFLSR